MKDPFNPIATTRERSVCPNRYPRQPERPPVAASVDHFRVVACLLPTYDKFCATRASVLAALGVAVEDEAFSTA